MPTFIDESGNTGSHSSGGTAHARLAAKLVGKVTFGGSAPDEMLRLADMIRDATGAFIDSKDKQWYTRISDRDLRQTHAS